MTANPQTAPSYATRQSASDTHAKVQANKPSQVVSRRPRSRPAPFPNSVLDRKALVAELEKEGLYGTFVQPAHVSSFYQCLHRQHYPNLKDFVANYYKHESALHDPSIMLQDNRPLKNPLTNKKNRNKMQLPKKLLQFLKTTHSLATVTSTLALKKTSLDGSTTKLAIRLHDGQLVESVLMRYTRSTASGSRASLCVSSQCGCAMGCTFCATGTMGLSGNLTTGEILEQIVHADHILADEYKELQSQHEDETNLPKVDLVRNVVFMGMGEPLDNYKNVVEACRALIDNKRWNLAHGKVTVSTVGIIDKIRRITKELPEISLALSLHAPNQSMRSTIVPTARYFPIEKLIEALDDHMMTYLYRRKKLLLGDNGNGLVGYTVEERIKESTRRRTMIEYIMLDGDTSTLEAAHQLGKLCEGRHLVVNLIPYNKTDVKDKLSCPSYEHMERFRSIVASYGTFCTVRRTMGADIGSACGQLITSDRDAEEINDDTDNKPTYRDIEDVVSTSHVLQEENGKLASKQQKRGIVLGANSVVGKNHLDKWIMSLRIATTLAGVTFVLSSALYFRQRKR